MVNGRVHLIELGAQSASLWEQHANLLHGGLRCGQVYELSRSTARSPIRAECLRQVEAKGAVDQMDVARRVMAVYKYPCSNPGETLEQYDARIHKMAVVRCRRMCELLKRGVSLAEIC